MTSLIICIVILAVVTVFALSPKLRAIGVSLLTTGKFPKTSASDIVKDVEGTVSTLEARFTPKH